MGAAPYPVQMPAAVRALYPSAWFRLPGDARTVFLTFDDGPEPTVTPAVLDILSERGAKASFFVLGARAQEHPHLMDRIRREGHTVGNHTHHHPDGWRTPQRTYLREVLTAQAHTGTRLFRPPYGRLSPLQYRALKDRFRVVLWDVLSGDFDEGIDARRCTANVLRNVRPGSIIVFHDSLKAAPRMLEALPRVLQGLAEQGLSCEALPETGERP